MNPKIIRIIRWITRIWSALVVVTIVSVFIANTIVEWGDPSSPSARGEFLVIGAFILTWIGLILGWKWEVVGGALTVGGMAAFYIIDLILSGSFPRGPIFIIIALPGVLFLYLGLTAGIESK